MGNFLNMFHTEAGNACQQMNSTQTLRCAESAAKKHISATRGQIKERQLQIDDRELPELVRQQFEDLLSCVNGSLKHKLTSTE